MAAGVKGSDGQAGNQGSQGHPGLKGDQGGRGFPGLKGTKFYFLSAQTRSTSNDKVHKTGSV